MQKLSESRLKSFISQFIGRMPILIKAVIAGIVVYAIGSFPSLVIISIMPFPFSLVALFAFLYLYLKYCSGDWGGKDASFVEVRARNFRSKKLTGYVLGWSLIGALLFVAIQQSMFVITFRLFEYDPDVMLTFQLGDLPPWFLWFTTIASALIAGVSEEVGFRGYMQVPLEMKYKPVLANIVVSAIFLLFHLNQGWAQPSLYVLLYASSFLIGMLTIASDSLIPGIIAHFLVDIFNFSYWWSDLAGKFEYKPIHMTGIDTHFFVWGAVLIVSLLLFLGAVHQTKKMRLNTLLTK